MKNIELKYLESNASRIRNESYKPIVILVEVHPKDLTSLDLSDLPKEIINLIHLPHKKLYLENEKIDYYHQFLHVCYLAGATHHLTLDMVIIAMYRLYNTILSRQEYEKFLDRALKSKFVRISDQIFIERNYNLYKKFLDSGTNSAIQINKNKFSWLAQFFNESMIENYSAVWENLKNKIRRIYAKIAEDRSGIHESKTTKIKQSRKDLFNKRASDTEDE